MVWHPCVIKRSDVLSRRYSTRGMGHPTTNDKIATRGALTRSDARPMTKGACHVIFPSSHLPHVRAPHLQVSSSNIFDFRVQAPHSYPSVRTHDLVISMGWAMNAYVHKPKYLKRYPKTRKSCSTM